MSTTLPLLLTSCRIHSGDGPSDNFARGENVNSTGGGNVVDGTNTTFYTQNFPIAAMGACIADNRTASTVAIVDATAGIISVTPGPTTSLYVSYNYYLFTDDIWTEFVMSALELLNISTGTPVNDVPNVPEGLLPAVKMFSGHFFCMRLSVQTGLWYNQRLQERVEDRDSISRKFASLADTRMKQGIAARDSFYNGAGTNFRPAFAINQMQPSHITPSH